MKLLLIEDEKHLSEPLTKALRRKNYIVDQAFDGKTGYEKAQINNYDCIILDLNLPEIDGIEVAQKLRESNNHTPILMLTARSSRKDKLTGFKSGTDDYLTKPFDFKELLYRIQALIRRSAHNKSTRLEHKELAIEPASMKTILNGEEIHLNAKEFGILQYLIRNKGRIISQEELLEHVWDDKIDIFTDTVRTNIKTLRKKVDPQKAIIRTVRGKGYIIDSD